MHGVCGAGEWDHNWMVNACTLPQRLNFRIETSNTMHTFGLFARGSFAQNKSIAHTIDRVYCSGTGACKFRKHTMNGSARQTIQWFSTPRYNVCGRPRQAVMPECTRAHAIQPSSPEPGWLLRNLQSICDFFSIFLSPFFHYFYCSRFDSVSLLAFWQTRDTRNDTPWACKLACSANKFKQQQQKNTENKTIASVAIAFRCSSVVRSFRWKIDCAREALWMKNKMKKNRF